MNDNLTKREHEILALIGHGNTDGEIAELLSLSPSTVTTHRKKLLSKIGAKNAPHLIYIAMRKGFMK